ALRRCKVELHAPSDCPSEYGSGNAEAARWAVRQACGLPLAVQPSARSSRRHFWSASATNYLLRLITAPQSLEMPARAPRTRLHGQWQATCLTDRPPCRLGITAPILARTIGGSMQFDLTPPQRALQAKARELARGGIAERAAEI